MSTTTNGAAPRRTPAKKASPARKAAPIKQKIAEARKNPTWAPDDGGDPQGGQEQILPSAFNLDELEREGTKEPFAFIHNGRQYVLTDPAEIDWQRLVLVVNNPIQFLRLVLRPEDVDTFFEQGMPTWKLRKLTETYQAHFGFGAPGESDGLPA